jgi:murein DD-endopeptidase MepM/ murein hydrolase activator NlpD
LQKKIFFLHIYTPLAEKKYTRFKKVQAFLRNKYRFVILNDTTFGESFSLKLSPGGLLTAIAAITIVMTTLVISLVAFTPLREYIPGYGNVTERKQILELSMKADSLEQTFSAKDEYLANILNVLNEKVEGKPEKPKKDTTGKYAKVNISASKIDADFRKDFEKNKDGTVAVPKLYMALSQLVFFTPVKGLVTSSYNLSEEHFGVDIATKKDETIKATLDGTVLYCGFSSQDGYVIQLQHNNNLISIYKHNADLLKKVGERVKSGEAISVVGNTGENSKGPHLHFELWYNGLPINPQEMVAF